MQFVVIARDGSDQQAIERRLAARSAHIDLGNKLREEGRHLYGVALLDDNEKMIGSVLVVDFEDLQAVNDWLEIEPYVTGNVWEHIEVHPCRVGPSFLNLKAA